MKKVKNFHFEIALPLNSSIANTEQSTPPHYHGQQSVKEITKVIRLSLSGGKLVVNVGGGYFDFLEYLDRKGVLVTQGAGEKLATESSCENSKYMTL